MPDIDPVPTKGTVLGRAFAAGWPHPALVTVRDGTVFDITENGWKGAVKEVKPAG